MSWRLLLHDLVTGTLVGEVRPTAASWQRALNGGGSATVTTPTAALTDAIGQVQTRLGRTCLSVLDPGGTLAWSGVIWQATVNLDGDTQLAAAPLMSVLERRVVRSDLSYTSTDQATIAAALVDHAQDTASGTRNDRQLHIDTSGVTSHGVTRTVDYLAAEAKPISQALLELADTAAGFTLDLVPTLGASYALSHTLELTHPASGVATATVLVHRSNVLVGQLSIDATAMTTDLVAFGTDGVTSSSSSPVTGWPALEASVSWSDVATTAELDLLAGRQLDLGSAPLVLPAVQVIADTNPASLDHVVRLVVPELNLDANYRVLQVSTTLAGHVALAALTLGNAELYA